MVWFKSSKLNVDKKIYTKVPNKIAQNDFAKKRVSQKQTRRKNC